MQKRFALEIDSVRSEVADNEAGILLAVSGGVDSMCMADLFQNLEKPVAFAVAHCNFRLRSEESDGDETLVRSWAEAHGVRFHHISFDTVKYASDKGVSIEMAARELRYDWFAQLCAEHGYRYVAVAHNANDNAETLLLNLVRGTGLKGISGMSVISELPCTNSSSAKLFRPLLNCTRKQIEGYALYHSVRYREDSTNSSVEYRRNSFRHEVLPVFERMNPSCIRTLNREMGYFSDASAIVDDWCREHVAEVCPTAPGSDGCVLDVAALLQNNRWHYLLYYILEPYGFNTSVIESLESLLISDRTVSGKRFESDSHTLFTERGELHISRKLMGHDASSVMPVRGAGVYNHNGVRFKVEVVEWTSDMPLKQPDGTLIMNADKLTFPFVCRCWRKGDWMIPFGMSGRKKISDLFADLKFNRIQKERALMIVDCSGDLAEKQHVAGVLGVRIDRNYRVDEHTTSVVRISVME